MAIRNLAFQALSITALVTFLVDEFVNDVQKVFFNKEKTKENATPFEVQTEQEEAKWWHHLKHLANHTVD